MNLKTLICAAISCTIFTYAVSAAPQLTETKPIVENDEAIYEIADGEILINDKMITLFAFTENGISVSYRNKTKTKAKPKYLIQIYNPYGLLLGEKKIGQSAIITFGTNTYMGPGAN